MPTIPCLEDDDDDVRYAASETLGRLLDQVDIEIKLRLVDLLVQYDDTSIPLKTGIWIGPIYRSFDVGYVGLKPKSNFQIKQAIIRTFSRMGMPLEIVAIGADAVTACLQRCVPPSNVASVYKSALARTCTKLFIECIIDGVPKH